MNEQIEEYLMSSDFDVVAIGFELLKADKTVSRGYKEMLLTTNNIIMQKDIHKLAPDLYIIGHWYKYDKTSHRPAISRSPVSTFIPFNFIDLGEL